MSDADFRDGELISLTVEIVTSYVSNNSVISGDLPALIGQVHVALKAAAGGRTVAPVEAPKPAVSIKKSIEPDHIVCLEDGKKFKSVKRHLRTSHGMTPDEYRHKWGLPADYPMVAPNYAAARSDLARKMGLGQVRQAGKAPKGRGRPSKAKG